MHFYCMDWDSYDQSKRTEENPWTTDFMDDPPLSCMIKCRVSDSQGVEIDFFTLQPL